jgi:hypothetical protein
MSASQSLVEAVQTAIVASAHLAAYENVASAAQACHRLGSLTSGRWRSAARDLDILEDDLQTAFTTAAEAVTARAESVGIPEDALWTVGDAAGTLDLLRESALDEVEPESRAARLLQGQVLFGASTVEDTELPDRGTLLLFGWPEPLSPATWPWQANWVSSGGDDDDDDDDGEADELDLFEAGELEGEDSMLAEIADELSCSRDDARVALREAALALTRASLLSGTDDDEEDEDAEDNEHTLNGEP